MRRRGIGRARTKGAVVPLANLGFLGMAVGQ
jgi:hypothetical protein